MIEHELEEGLQAPDGYVGARPWSRPELHRLEAGAAETSGAVSDDGVIGNS